MFKKLYVVDILKDDKYIGSAYAEIWFFSNPSVAHNALDKYVGDKLGMINFRRVK